MEKHQVDILKTLYTQQQSTAHILREKISKISTGAIGLLVVIDGWLITNKQDLASSHVTMLMISICIIVWVALYGIYSRYKEFSAVARLIVRIEMAMKIYESGAYIDNESLYPSEFKNLGKKGYEHGKNIFLSQAYILGVFGLLSVCLALFF
jgi:hypothetical protein